MLALAGLVVGVVYARSVGTWGTGLYADDTAADLKHAWSEGIRWSATPDALTDNLLSQYGENDTVVWLALADLQWKSGHLLPRVRDKALEIIANGADLVRWKEAGN